MTTPETPPPALQTCDVVFPAQANHRGTLFAGNALHAMARAAWAAARAAAGRDVVMAAVTHVQFIAPVPVGHVLTLRARLARTGRSSLTVHVGGWCEAPGAAPREALKGVFELVAVDPHGRPAPLAHVAQTPETTPS